MRAFKRDQAVDRIRVHDDWELCTMENITIRGSWKGPMSVRRRRVLLHRCGNHVLQAKRCRCGATIPEALLMLVKLQRLKELTLAPKACGADR